VPKARGSRRLGVGRGFPLPTGEGVWEGMCPLPRKSFRIWCLEMAYFGAFWCVIIRPGIARSLKHVLQMYVTLARNRPPQQPV